mmetsp:Transcript_24146/g.59109  ORF Transcript_24146/g.59109 Transcript_24146/m.59109 type:complete len:529 (+) Transcript_24146:124-1710(+)|eukprot:CAMPEP_0113651818 /NCGR_PEP_ID=MMETSP0017_2-20120614/27639_1 /TAXON_ID=2856 /ORGANISM="Cylindrotheca closterium" /LENGTH=528 /DNA_ID=CAMNT_0000564551 /DNA_START=8 /DNA_END=1594 /DNA_ORIENTATION=- /assembly_acc=CAM_ASM_000147
MMNTVFQKCLGGIFFTISVTVWSQFRNDRIQPPQSYVQQDHQQVAALPSISSSNHSWPIPQQTNHHDHPSDSMLLHELPINENSTIASDIDKIWHDQQAICVRLKENARCKHPALLGRLSGPALAILEWSERPSDDDTTGTTTVLCGDYSNQWLDAGYYFVEIIVLYCEDFGVTSLLNHHDRGVQDQNAWLEADHTSKCVEDARYNRITSKEGRTIISIPSSIEGKGSYRRGRWVRKPHLPLRALFTRYQPIKCAMDKDFVGNSHIQKGTPMHKYCKSIVARDKKPQKGKRLKKGENDKLAGLHEYDFQWNMPLLSEKQLVQKLRQRQRDANDDKATIPKICAIGDSHSRTMVERSLPALNLTGLFEFVQSNWIRPDAIVERIRRSNNTNCDHFFVQVGQWPASFRTGGHPFSFGTYYTRLKAQVENILAYNPNAKVYLPTIDQNPLMAKINNCSDWRTPTMLDGYSHMNKMIANELGSRVEYLDTNFIIYTHWDGHPDWQHLLEEVRYRKTLYMAAIMLGETEWWSQ